MTTEIVFVIVIGASVVVLTCESVTIVVTVAVPLSDVVEFAEDVIVASVVS